MSGENIDLENLSDEDFIKQMDTMEVPAPESDGEDEDDEPTFEAKDADDVLEHRLPPPPGLEAETGSEEEEEEDTSNSEGDDPEAGQSEDGDKPDEGAEAADGEDPSKASDHTTPHQTDDSKAKSDAEEENGEGDEGEGEEDTGKAADAEPDYKALYEGVMGGFKANGRDFKPNSPDEAIRLMQMGANYTKKMQALKPNLRLMKMLENQGLLDESKLNFLIDLEKKEPAAIQKLIHDAKIDPLEIDASEEPAYKPGNHGVSDQDMTFHDAITDVTSTDNGKETISHVHNTWDDASKDAIYKEPAILRAINEQRANGIYDQISAEIDRERMLGNLTDTPFIQAYKSVGDRLHKAGKLVPNTASPTPNTENNGNPNPAPAVVESRTETPKKQMPNGAKAKAASSGPKAAKSKPQEFNPLTMSDEEIMRITSPQI